MTQLNVTAGTFANLQDSGSVSPALSVIPFIGPTPVTAIISPKNTTPASLPTVASSTTVSSFFANEGTTTGVVPTSWTGGFNSATSTGLEMSPQAWGIKITTGALSHSSNYKIGLGTHYEDMIITFQVPVTGVTFLLGNDDNTPSRGKLQIAKIGATWRFQWVQRETGGSSDVTYTFDGITVPIMEFGAGVSPSPFYLRVVREIPAATGSGDQGQINLIVNDGTSEQTQTITPTARLDTTISASDAKFGGSTAVSGQIGTVTCFWHRAIWSDSAATVGTLTTTRWISPTIYETKTYLSNTSNSVTYLDSGAADQYWQAFGFPGNNVTLQGGGRLKARFAPHNTQGSETFSGSQTVMQSEVINELADLQGRYLALEMEFTVGTDWPLSMGAPVIIGDAALAMATSIHDSATHTSETIVIPVPGEGDSGGVLPYTPDYPVRVRLTPRSKLEQFESPYSVGYALGTKARRKFSVSWTLTSSERATLEAFFLARDGGEQAFTWTAPGDDSTSKAALNSALSTVKLSPNAFRLAAELEEVF